MNQSWLQNTKDRLQDERDAINAMDITPKVHARPRPLSGATSEPGCRELAVMGYRAAWDR